MSKRTELPAPAPASARALRPGSCETAEEGTSIRLRLEFQLLSLIVNH